MAHLTITDLEQQLARVQALRKAQEEAGEKIEGEAYAYVETASKGRKRP